MVEVQTHLRVDETLECGLRRPLQDIDSIALPHRTKATNTKLLEAPRKGLGAIKLQRQHDDVTKRCFIHIKWFWIHTIVFLTLDH